MLVQKKIEGKKLAMYIVIIIFMISGAIFFIVKNNKIKIRKHLPVVMESNDMEFSDDADTMIGSANIEPFDKNDNTGEIETLAENEKIKLLNLNNVLDLDILFDQKFKKLKRAIINPVDFVVGNEDLFISIN